MSKTNSNVDSILGGGRREKVRLDTFSIDWKQVKTLSMVGMQAMVLLGASAHECCAVHLSFALLVLYVFAFSMPFCCLFDTLSLGAASGVAGGVSERVNRRRDTISEWISSSRERR